MRCFPGLFLILLLLTGCAAHRQPDAPDALSAGRESIVLYDPESPWEAPGHRSFQSYALTDIACSAIFSLGDDILLLGQESALTQLARLDVRTGNISNFLTLPPNLSAERWNNCLLCFDTDTRETIIVTSQLQIARRISPPEGLIGKPALSQSGDTLYYCTKDAIRAMDLHSGISRILKASSYPEQTIAGLILHDAVLACRLEASPAKKTIFLCTQTGRTLRTTEALQNIRSSGNHYYAQIQEGSLSLLVFGTPDGSPSSILLPDHTASQFILAEQHSLLGVIPTTGTVQLDYYDLRSGKRTATVSLPASSIPSSFAASDGTIWFLQDDSKTLCCWNPALSPANDGACYTSKHFTRENPDISGIEQCIQYSKTIAQRYGIQVLLYQDAARKLPGHRLSLEYLTPVLMKELKQVEQSLSNYPAEILQTLTERFDGISICILRQIHPIICKEEAPKSVTFWDGHHVYIALTAGADTERTLYHEICHLIDTIVLGGSSAYDTWNQWNPTGFQYDYDYITNQNRNSTAYLLDTSRYFIDMYAMSFPKEDRARIMEYAMTAGNAHLFQTDAMQGKLRTLSTGIREAFGLNDCTRDFLWEQYLR